MRPTLVFIKAHYIDGSLVHRVGDECPPNTFSTQVINQALDERHLVECPERRSLFRLLHRFSGAAEKEQLTNEEKNKLCI
jgi:hypothetical protein